MSLLVAAASSFWFGVLTATHPCPLASTVAAISFVGRRAGDARHTLASGLIYAAGLTGTYVLLASLLVTGALSVPAASRFFQRYVNALLGPVLILVGMVLLDLVRPRSGGRGISAELQTRVERRGIWGAGLLGVLFALSFCPGPAFLYFGCLIPLCVKLESRLVLPACYGLGAAAPVIGVALALSLGARGIGKLFGAVAVVERWARRLTGAILIAVGVYYSLVHGFGVL